MSEQAKDDELVYLANDLIELRNQVIETGITAAKVIARDQPEVFQLLQDTFNSDDVEIAGWLTHTLMVFRKSPLEMIAENNLDEVQRLLESSINGLPA